MKQLAEQASRTAASFETAVMDRVEGGIAQSRNLTDGRLVEMSRSLVQLIVRNLYERTADVRWWATDPAMRGAMCATAEAVPAARIHASSRLETIHRYYSVYRDLVLVDPSGQVVASAVRRQGAAKDVSAAPWFRDAMNGASGDSYAVSRVERAPEYDGDHVLTYATAVRDGGERHGKAIGVLGVHFDWERQSRSIVCDEPTLTAEERTRTRVMLLDDQMTCIAASDGRGLLSRFPLQSGGRKSGAYRSDGATVAFAETIGYQEYDGLGWRGVIVQQD